MSTNSCSSLYKLASDPLFFGPSESAWPTQSVFVATQIGTPQFVGYVNWHAPNPPLPRFVSHAQWSCSLPTCLSNRRMDMSVAIFSHHPQGHGQWTTFSRFAFAESAYPCQQWVRRGHPHHLRHAFAIHPPDSPTPEPYLKWVSRFVNRNGHDKPNCFFAGRLSASSTNCFSPYK